MPVWFDAGSYPYSPIFETRERSIAYAIACRTATSLRSGFVRLMKTETFETGDVVEVRHGGCLELEGDLAAAASNALEHRPDGLQVESLVLLDQLEGVEHVGCCERLAVRPLHVRPDGEGDRLVVVGPCVLR